jgi:hypothetical protein
VLPNVFDADTRFLRWVLFLCVTVDYAPRTVPEVRRSPAVSTVARPSKCRDDDEGHRTHWSTDAPSGRQETTSQRAELPTSGADDSSQDTAAYSTRHDRENGEPLSHSVVLAVAEATGTDPSSMQPLYGTIESEALDDLFQQRDGGPASLATVTSRSGTRRVT